MENASKALIIAGSILLAIAIIGLGMGVFNKVSDIGGGAGLDSEKIAAYNSKFEAYVGTKKGSEALNLCRDVKAHNLANVDDPSKNINIKLDTATATSAPSDAVTTTVVDTVMNGIKSGYTYTINVIKNLVGLHIRVELRKWFRKETWQKSVTVY